MLQKLLLIIFISFYMGRFLPTPNLSASNWNTVVKNAKGQTVYFHAWGGNSSINKYLQWVAKQMQVKYSVKVKHIKVTDAAISVSQVLAEKRAGLNTNGSIDAIWVNGENFKTLKENNLLNESFVSKLPNNKYLDYQNKTLTRDFTLDTEDKELPWGLAQLVFFYDSARVKNIPKSAEELLLWTQNNKGKFTYPKPPEFHGVTFVKQILLSLNYNDLVVFSKPVAKPSYKKYTQKLWNYLDKLHPNLWRKGKTFPKTSAALVPLLDEGVIDIAISFNPYAADNYVATGILPDTVRTYNWKGGTVGNVHFVAITFNSAATAGAKVLANFLISPEAQARKADPQYWGDPTVLDLNRLKEKSFLFDRITYRKAAPRYLHRVLSEPHPSWTELLELEWLRRYSK